MSVKNNNISIKVISHFVKNRSSPENSIFLFSYDVKIKNNGDSEVQLYASIPAFSLHAAEHID